MVSKEDREYGQTAGGHTSTEQIDNVADMLERTSATADIRSNLAEPKSEIRTRGEELALGTDRLENRGYFHYKRWIWVMFPWACMCSKDKVPFSYLMSRCFESATQYMSVVEEEQLSRDALEIAFAYKRRINVLLHQEEQKQKAITSRLEDQKQSESEVVSPLLRHESSADIKIVKKKTDIIKVLRDIRKKKEEEALIQDDDFLTSRKNSKQPVEQRNQIMRVRPIRELNILNDSLRHHAEPTLDHSLKDIATTQNQTSRANLDSHQLSDRSHFIRNSAGRLPSIQKEDMSTRTGRSHAILKKRPSLNTRQSVKQGESCFDRSAHGLSVSREIQNYTNASMRKLEDAKSKVTDDKLVHRAATESHAGSGKHWRGTWGPEHSFPGILYSGGEDSQTEGQSEHPPVQ